MFIYLLFLPLPFLHAQRIILTTYPAKPQASIRVTICFCLSSIWTYGCCWRGPHNLFTCICLYIHIWCLETSHVCRITTNPRSPTSSGSSVSPIYLLSSLLVLLNIFRNVNTVLDCLLNPCPLYSHQIAGIQFYWQIMTKWRPLVLISLNFCWLCTSLSPSNSANTFFQRRGDVPLLFRAASLPCPWFHCSHLSLNFASLFFSHIFSCSFFTSSLY